MSIESGANIRRETTLEEWKHYAHMAEWGREYYNRRALFEIISKERKEDEVLIADCFPRFGTEMVSIPFNDFDEFSNGLNRVVRTYGELRHLEILAVPASSESPYINTDDDFTFDIRSVGRYIA